MFEWLNRSPRRRELVGASIGGWRFACAMQAEPRQALARLAERYTDETYAAKIGVADITRQTRLMLDEVLPPEARAALIDHPHYQLSLLLVRSHGMLASEARAAAGRPGAERRAQRRVPRPAAPRLQPGDLPRPAQRLALQARGRHPYAVPAAGNGQSGRRADGHHRHSRRAQRRAAAGRAGRHLPRRRPDRLPSGLPFAHGDDIVLYPHFTERIVPGWFDKFLPWRGSSPAHHANTVLIAPSRDYLARRPAASCQTVRTSTAIWAGTLSANRFGARPPPSQRLGDAFMAWLERPDLGQVQAF